MDIVMDYTDSDSQSLTPEVKELLLYTDDFMVTAVDCCGGKMWFDITTTNRCYGKWTNLNKELNFVRNLDTEELFEIVNEIISFDSGSAASLQKLIDKTGESPLMRLMLTITINDLCNSWLRDEAYMEVGKPDFEAEYINVFFDDLLIIMSNTEPEFVYEDLETIVNVCRILTNKISAFEEGNYKLAADLFSGGSFEVSLKKEVRKNPRMSDLELAIEKLIIGAISEEVLKLVEKDRDSLYKDIAMAITSSSSISSDKRINLVAADIKQSLEDHGIYAPEEMTKKATRILISTLSYMGNDLAAEDVEIYFDTYRNYSYY